MSRTAVYEVVQARLILKTTTSAGGSTWVKMGSANGAALTDTTAACRTVSVINNTGTSLSFGIGVATASSPTGETLEIPSGCSYNFEGLTDCRQLFVRRDDLSASQVTFKALSLN